MDDKRCARLNHPCLPSPGCRLEDRKCTGNQKRRRRFRDRGSTADIVYVKNPLFESVKPFESLHRGKESSNSAGDRFPRIFFPSLDYRCSGSQSQTSPPKSRKDRMKARAESRRDSLIEQSSDEDYSSSINSSNDLRPGSSSNMEDAYNRRSRAARTERYFRRLSREEIFHDTYDFNTPVMARNNQDARPQIGRETQLLSPPPPPHHANPKPRSPNLLFYKQDNAGFNNPTYNTSVFNFNRRCERRPEILEKRGSSFRLPYKNDTVEPKIPNCRDSDREKIARPVQRSCSFQIETPCLSTTQRKAQESDRSGGSNSRIERKWIDSITSSASKNSNPLSSGDFQRRKLTPVHDSNSSNLFSALTEDKISQKKRSSKDLRKELSELEKMYTSLRLSDDNLLERAEERCVEEFSLKSKAKESKHLAGSSSESIPEDGNLKGEKNEADVVNDDMAYRKMQSKRMPALSETQNSLSQISYLLASSALILDKNIEYPDIGDEEEDEEPNITKDDVVYRNLHYANNVLKVVEPQPPFGIPLRPATPSTNSNYLCSSPVALKSPPLKYVPQSEPNLVTDDLAFRNLRKDAPKTPPPLVPGENEKKVNVLDLKNELDKSLSDDIFFRKKKRAVRSLSANLYGLINDVKNLELNIK